MRKIKLEDIQGIKGLTPTETFEFMVSEDLIPRLSKDDLKMFQGYLLLTGLNDAAAEIRDYEAPKMFIGQSRDYLLSSKDGFPRRIILLGRNPFKDFFTSSGALNAKYS